MKFSLTFLAFLLSLTPACSPDKDTDAAGLETTKLSDFNTNPDSGIGPEAIKSPEQRASRIKTDHVQPEKTEEVWTPIVSSIGSSKPSARNLTVLESRVLDQEIQEQSFSFSPDGSQIACIPAWNGSMIRIFDVATLKPLYQFGVPFNKANLAWSPDMTRIFAYAYGSEPVIVELSDLKVVHLPVDITFLVHQKSVFWHSDDKIYGIDTEFEGARLKDGLQLGSGDAVVMDLETLHLNFVRTLIPDQELRAKQLSSVLDHNKSFKADRDYYLYSHGNLFAADMNESYHRSVIQSNTGLTASPSGLHAAKIQNDNCILYYLGAGQQSYNPKLFSIQELNLNNGGGASLARNYEDWKNDDLRPDKHGLTPLVVATIHPPIRNPLNDQIIRADRSSLKGIVRVIDSSGPYFKCVSVMCSDKEIVEGDVVGTFYILEIDRDGWFYDFSSKANWSPSDTVLILNEP